MDSSYISLKMNGTKEIEEEEERSNKYMRDTTYNTTYRSTTRVLHVQCSTTL